jgi:hypothetical protein
VVFAFLSRNPQLDHLAKLVTDLRPEQDAATVKAVAAVVFWGALGALVVVIIIEALLLLRVMHRHGGARWALLCMALVQGGVGVLAVAFLVAPGAEGNTVFLLLAAAWVLAGAALVAGVMPGAGAWFRAEHQPSGRPT